MNETLEERIVRLARASGHELTPEKLSKLRAHFGLPDPVESVEAAPEVAAGDDDGADGGGSGFDVFQGAVARGFGDMVRSGQFVNEQFKRVTGFSPSPVQDYALEKARGWLGSIAEAPENQPSEENAGTFWGEDFPNTVGSVVPQAVVQGAAALATGGMSLLGMAALAGAQGAATEGVAAYDDALGAGAPEETAWMSFLGHAALGSTEALGALPGVSLGKLGKLAGVLKRFDGETAGALSRSLAGNAVTGFATEFAQETGQGSLGVLWDRYLELHPEDTRTVAEVFSDTAIHAGVPAGVLGAFLGGVDQAASRRLQQADAEAKAQRTEREGLKPVPASQTSQEAPGSTQAEPMPQREGQAHDPFYKRLRSDEAAAIEGEVDAPESLAPLQEAARRRGHKLRFVKTRPESTFRGAFDRDTGDVAVNVNRSDEAIEYTLDHELTHALEQRSGGSFEGYRAEIQAVDPEGLAAMEQEAKARAPETSLEDLQGEQTAYYTEEVLGPWIRAVRRDPAKMAKIAEGNRPLFRRMGEALLDVVNAFTGTRFQTQRQQLREMLGETGFIGRRMPPEKAVRLAQKFVEVAESLGPKNAAWNAVREDAAMFNASQQAAVNRRRNDAALQAEQGQAAPPGIAGPATEEPGITRTPIEQVPDAQRYSRAPIRKREIPYTEKLLRRFVDSNRAIETEVRKTFGDTSSTYLGVAGKEEQDPILGVRLERNVRSREIRAFNAKYMNPIAEALKEMKVPVEDFGDYLYARHAPEADAYIASVGGPSEGGSGMQPAEVKAITDRWKNDPRGARVEALALRVDQMNREALETRRKSGLLTEDDENALVARFKHYVPLRTNTDARNAYGTGRRGVRGKEYQQRTGRSTKADNPLVYSLVQAKQGIERAVHNDLVLERAAKFIEAKNDPKFASAVPVKDPNTGKTHPLLQTRTVENGEVKWTYDPRALDAENVVPFKRGGEQWAMVFDESQVDFAAALKNGNIDNLPQVLGFLPQVNDFIKKSTTVHNPVFGVINGLFRDPIQTFLRQSSEKDAGFALRVLRDIPKMSVDLATGGKWSQRYAAAGGMMPTRGSYDFNATLKEVQKELNTGQLKEASRRVIGVFDRFNEVMENQARLATFKNLIEQKFSDERAALGAQEANVNFGTRGEFAPFFDALYAFWGANMAGSRAMVLALKGKHVKPMIGSVIVGSMLIDAMGRAMAGEDETGENAYDKIPEWEKASNLIVMRGPGSTGYLKIPLPPGFAFLFNVGRYLNEAAWGPGTATTSASKTLGNLLGNTLPFGGNVVGDEENFTFSDSGVLQMATPTIADPVVQALTNADWRGKKIRPEDLPFGPQHPDSELYYKSRTSAVAASLTSALNELFDFDDSGKADIEAFDISPATLQHLVRGYLPGVWQEGIRLGGIAERWRRPDLDVGPKDVPLASRLWGNGNPYQVEQDYREKVVEIEAAKQRYDDLREAKQGLRAIEWRKANMAAFRAIGAMQATEKLLRKLPDTPEAEIRKHEAKARFLRRVRSITEKSE